MSGISPKVESRKSPIQGHGLFAKEPILKGEIILDFSKGTQQFVSGAEADDLYKGNFDHMLQVDENRFLVTVKEFEPVDRGHVNHSCDPNCGMKDGVKIVAMRTIEPDEELTLDYAMMESSDYSFKCECGRKNCRAVITGTDWKIPELQKRYGGYFQNYLQMKIDKVK